MVKKKNPRAKNVQAWPSVEEQLAASRAVKGTALEKLIRDNQDFEMLRPEEASDNIKLPHWLRVSWRKQHPKEVYSAKDPTGGYPRVLKNLHSWMILHQDLRRPGRIDQKRSGKKI